MTGAFPLVQLEIGKCLIGHESSVDNIVFIDSVQGDVAYEHSILSRIRDAAVGTGDALVNVGLDDK
jgi:hypothetical protein